MVARLPRLQITGVHQHASCTQRMESLALLAIRRRRPCPWRLGLPCLLVQIIRAIDVRFVGLAAAKVLSYHKQRSDGSGSMSFHVPGCVRRESRMPSLSTSKQRWTFPERKTQRSESSIATRPASRFAFIDTGAKRSNQGKYRRVRFTPDNTRSIER